MACSMLIVPRRVPLPVATGKAGTEPAAPAAGPEGVAALLVLASAAIANRTAAARERRINLLVIGWLNSLERSSGTNVFPSIRFLRSDFTSQIHHSTLGRTDEGLRR